MTIITFVAVWRFAWYTYLVWHSLKYRAYRDVGLGAVLIILAFVAGVGSSPVTLLSAFIVAPFITLTIAQYQKNRKIKDE